MELIVAVYEDWGIGRGGTQPIALAADRKFFRETTKGCMVIAGRRTVEDFPGRKPLPGRENVLLTRQGGDSPGFTLCESVGKVLELAKRAPRAMVIGGGSVYRQLLPRCNKAYVTKLKTRVECDTWFPDLDKSPDWKLAKILGSGEENGIAYTFCLYERTGDEKRAGGAEG